MSGRCRHFRSCGGCATQHISYEEQLALKSEAIEQLFGSSLPILPAPSPWEYRNKMEFSFGQTSEKRFLGLMQKGRRRVEDLAECHLVPPWFVEVMERFRPFWEESGLKAYYPPKDLGALRTLTVRGGVRTGERLVALTVSGNPAFPVDECHLQRLLEVMGPLGLTSLVVRVQHAERKKPTWFEERVLTGVGHMREILYRGDQSPVEFQIRPSSFFQPNTLQAEQLYKRAIELAELRENDTVFDLYCGTGAIGLFVAPYCREVFGIEIHEEAVRDAEENIHRNGISTMRVVAGDVAERLAGNPTVVFVDPPRCGLLPPALQKLLELAPQRILYISCNPQTQAANVADLVRCGYEMTAVQPVDQFPHTPHIENIVALRRTI